MSSKKSELEKTHSESRGKVMGAGSKAEFRCSDWSDSTILLAYPLPPGWLSYLRRQFQLQELFRKWLKSTCSKKQTLWMWSDHMCWYFQEANICRLEQGTYSTFHLIQQCIKASSLHLLVNSQNSNLSMRGKKCLAMFFQKESSLVL